MNKIKIVSEKEEAFIWFMKGFESSGEEFNDDYTPSDVDWKKQLKVYFEKKWENSKLLKYLKDQRIKTEEDSKLI